MHTFVMLGGQHHVLGARLLEEARPGGGVKQLGLEHWREIAVLEVGSVDAVVECNHVSLLLSAGVQVIPVPPANVSSECFVVEETKWRFHGSTYSSEYDGTEKTPQ